MVTISTSEPSQFIPKRVINIKNVDVQSLQLFDESGNISDEIKKVLQSDGVESISFKIQYKIPSEEV